MIRLLVKPVVVAAVLSSAHAARPMTAQTPAPEVALGFSVDTTAPDVGPIVRLLRAYLAAPASAARSLDLWRTGGSGDHTHDDLAARYALQGFPATVIGIVPTDEADSVYTVKLLHARAERAGGPAAAIALERLYAVRAAQSPFGWQLSAALPRLTKGWQTNTVGRITFRYAPGQASNKRRANAAALLVDSVATLFAVQPPAHIDYYVTASPDEYFRALGLDFFVSNSGPGESAGGNAMPDVGVLLAGDPTQGELYRHELVHVALGGRIRSGFINEGVAAWLGGSRRQSVQQLYRRLASFQHAHPEVTFTAMVADKLSVPHEPVASSDAWYASGALACDAVYRRAGVTGLRALADAPSDVDGLQRVLAQLLGIANDPDALDRWWRMAAAGPPLLPETQVAKRTFVYKRVGKLDLRADVYRPAVDGPRPVVMWLHPGALIMGSRDMLPSDERDRLLAAGFVVVAVDYRLAPETKLPEILRDVDDAHRWVRDRGPTLFGADPTRIAAMGASGGGYLALMAGARVRPRLKAIVSLYGYGDIGGTWYSRPDSFYNTLPPVSKEVAYRGIGQKQLSEGPIRERQAFYTYCRQHGLWSREVVGLDPDADAAKYGAYSPERLARADFPPTLLLHGDSDVDVPFQMSERMAAVLTRQHVEHRLIRMEGFNHAFDVFETYPPQGAPIGLRRPQAAEAFDRVVAFLEKELRR